MKKKNVLHTIICLNTIVRQTWQIDKEILFFLVNFVSSLF